MKTESDALALISDARDKLEAASTVQEVNRLIGIAKASEIYARQVKKSKEAITYATELVVYGERRLGELLSTGEKAKGTLKRGPVLPPQNSGEAPKTLEELGITRQQSSRAQKLAAIPEKKLQESIAQLKKKDHVITPATVIRQSRRKSNEHDFFPTPSWCVRRLLEACQLPVGMWLEPAVGDGSIVRAVNGVRPGVQWTTVDIRPECKPDRVGDFLELPVGGVAFDVAITNPPYNLAFDFVQSAMRRAKNVVMLLRLNWLASETRAGWLRENMPTDIYVLPNRPDFDGGGGDMTEYAWMLWTPEIDPEFRSSRYGRISVLKTTTLEERNKG